MTPDGRRTRPCRFRRGQWVEVRSPGEVFATLDAAGKLDGLPFQPEMLQFCGQRFRVFRRAEKVFLDHHYYVARLDDTVLLDGPRCCGRAHGGCQMRCLLLWKEAWLKPAAQETSPRGPAEGPAAENAAHALTQRLPVRNAARYCCQAAELAGAARRLAWWDARQYVRDVLFRELTAGQFFRMMGLGAYQKLRRVLGLAPRVAVRGTGARSPRQSLGLQPGEWVEVKSRSEIAATLDVDGKNRGLGFSADMAAFCGERRRVAGRVDRLVLEWSGEMRELADTVALENVLCDGLDKRGCPRACYHLWREIWLKRVTAPADSAGHETVA